MSTPMTIIKRLHGVGFLIGPHADAGCRTCGHVWGNHMVFASATSDPLDGGHVECPFHQCECRATWGLNEEQRAQAKLARDREA